MKLDILFPSIEPYTRNFQLPFSSARICARFFGLITLSTEGKPQLALKYYLIIPCTMYLFHPSINHPTAPCV